MASPTGFDGMWLPEGEDPRSDSNPQGELATYRDYLANYRTTLRLKCEGLSAEQLAARSVPPSSMSLLGLVRHLARVENAWFVWFLQGDWEQPRLYMTEADPDLDFNGAQATTACVDEAFTTWNQEIAKGEAWLDGFDETRLGDELPFPRGGTSSIRDVLVHLVEEYARHCGHADLLRECIDGRTGQ